MPKVGDQVIIEGAKVGQQRREGSLIGVTGRLLNVRWNDGTTSLLTPGAGSVRFLPKGTGKAPGQSRAKPAVPKKAQAAAKKPAAAAKKPAAARRKAPARAARKSTKKK